MATLYVENVPEELYEAVRQRARSERRSIAQEVIAILERFVPTPTELAERRRFVRKALRLSAHKPATAGLFPSSEEMLREDRTR
jgi:plasmid stability protein